MYRQWFDTGVRPINNPKAVRYDENNRAWRNGTMQIAFYLNEQPPKYAKLEYLVPEYPQNLPTNHKVYTVIAGGMLSNYAVYNMPVEVKNVYHP